MLQELLKNQYNEKKEVSPSFTLKRYNNLQQNKIWYYNFFVKQESDTISQMICFDCKKCISYLIDIVIVNETHLLISFQLLDTFGNGNTDTFYVASYLYDSFFRQHKCTPSCSVRSS